MFHSQLIAASDPAPFRKPRFIRWPSICDTTRTDWLKPQPRDLSPPSPALQNHVEYACMFDPRAGQPIDPRVLAASASIDCFAPSADPSLTFTALAAPPSASKQFYTTVTCALGVSLPRSKPTAPQLPPQSASKKDKKNGRPLHFDRVRRAELCAMVRTGCSLRNAAQNAGVKMSSIYYACRTDPAFAADLRSAEQERDVRGIRRINNAGEKSWRATAWLLERASPKHFSLRGLNHADSGKHLGKRRLKQLIAEALNDVLPKSLERHARQPMIDAASQRINQRLAGIEAQSYRPYDPRDDADQSDNAIDDDVADKLRSQAAKHGQSNEHGENAPPSGDVTGEDSAVEAAAQAVFQQLMHLLHQ